MITFKSFLFEAHDGDEWLKRYTVDATDKYPSKGAIADLLSKYPFNGGVLYRGLNFHDKEQYDDFLANTKTEQYLKLGTFHHGLRHVPNVYHSQLLARHIL